MNDFYVTSGTMQPGAPSYVERSADRELYAALSAGEFAYILTSRQMGKSSLIVRAAERLRAEGCATAILDLTAIGRSLTPEQWKLGLLLQLGSRIGVEAELHQFWQENSHLGAMNRWFTALERVALPALGRRPLIVFIDEIDTVRSLPFSTDELFAGIRECANRRAEQPILQRLTFCLIGVALPSELIRDYRTTPFNIGLRIELDDFTCSEAATLAAGLEPIVGPAVAPELLRRALFWTGGHPYLTQRLCQAIAGELCEGKRLATPHSSTSSPDRLPIVLKRNSGGRREAVWPPGFNLPRNGGPPNPASGSERPQGGGTAVWHGVRGIGPARLVDEVCGRLFLSRSGQHKDDNILFVRDRLTRLPDDAPGGVAALLDLYGRVRGNRRRAPAARRIEGHPLAELLRLSGVVRTAPAKAQCWQDRGGAVRVRNRIYEQVFNSEWVRANMPDVEIARQRRAFLRGAARATTVAAGVVLALTALALTAAARAHEARVAGAKATGFADRLMTSQKQLELALQEEREALASLRRVLSERDGEARIAGQEAKRATAAAGRAGESSRVARADEQLARRQTLAAQQAGQRARAGENDSLAQRIKLTLASAARAEEDGDPASALVWYARSAELEHRNSPALLLDRIRLASARAAMPRLLRLWRGVVDARFSSDGRTIAARLRSGAVVALSTDSGKEAIAETPAAIMAGPDEIRTVGDKALAIFQSGAYTRAHIVSVRTGQELVKTRRYEVDAMCGSFSPDGATFAVGCHDHTATLWDSDTGDRILPALQHNGCVTALCFSRDGLLLATGSADCTARVWDLHSGDPVTPPLWHGASVDHVALDPQARMLVTVDRSGVARLWDLAGLGAPDLQLGELGNVAAMAISPDGRRIATSDFDWGARLWQSATGRAASPVLRCSEREATAAYSPDGKLLATGRHVWRSADGSAVITLPAQAKQPSHVAWSPDSRILVTAVKNLIAAWSIAQGRQLYAIRLSGDVATLAYSPDGTRIAAAQDQLVSLSDSRTGRRIATIRHAEPVSRVLFNPSGRMLATASYDGTVRFWDSATGQSMGIPLAHSLPVQDIVFSLDGRRLVAATGENRSNGAGEARVWDITSRRPIGLPMRHSGTVFRAVISRDGRYVATGSGDGTARVWDANTGEPITPPLRMKRGSGSDASVVRNLEFLPRGLQIVTLSSDGDAEVWRLGSRQSGPMSSASAERVAGRVLDAGGGLSLRPGGAIPCAEATSANVQRLTCWYRKAAALRADRGQRAAAAAYLDELLALDPSDGQARVHRIIARAEVSDWHGVLGDARRLPGPSARIILHEAMERPRQVTSNSIQLSGGGPPHSGIVIVNANRLLVLLPSPAARFEALAGVDAHGEGAPRDCDFRVSVELGGRELYGPQALKPYGPPTSISVDLAGATAFTLVTKRIGVGSAVWADARVTLKDGRTLRLCDLPMQAIGAF